MLDYIKEALKSFFSSRGRVVIGIMCLFACILIGRLFLLQVVRGQDYLTNYDLKTEETETIDATRGNIYDRNGKLLAYNDLAYEVTISDSGTYDSTKEHNKKLNAELATIIDALDGYGDTIEYDFGITLNNDGDYEFTDDSETAQNRFRADVFGLKSASDLGYDKDLGMNTAEATPKQIMKYLMKERFDISSSYSKQVRYEITALRYMIWINRYQADDSTTIASNVSDETVAYIKENSDTLIGCNIKETTIRKYNDAEAMVSIIGYTGKISSDEYEEKHAEDSTVTTNDIVGKAGIEQEMDDVLSGTKGQKTVISGTSGEETVLKETKPESGGDVYLSIDSELQQNTYDLLEKEIAGILNSKIQNIKEYHLPSDGSTSNIVVPIYDVYFALINNNLLDIDEMHDSNATDVEKQIDKAYRSRKKNVLNSIEGQLFKSSSGAYESLSEEYQDYATYIVKKLRSDDVLQNDKIDKTDSTYQKWQDEKLSVHDYLEYCLSQNWIDYSKFMQTDSMVDTEELYQGLVQYILDDISSDTSFAKIVYHYAILNDEISGRDLCAALYDQKVLKKDKAERAALLNGTVTAYTFLKEKIADLEITPAQLALEPCTGSSVIMDAKTGEVLACVSYPGYDNNKLANNVDTDYYSYLAQNLATPLYNYATQQRTAPGSTFKLCTATAGLAEGVITTTSTIVTKGIFDKVSNKPRCWIYTQSHTTHGTINVTAAIRDSCNYFFYEVGWRLAGGDDHYNDAAGIKRIRKYARLYGLNEKTGVEIEENTPHIATEYPVMAAIGQSDNNYTTISLARYVTAVANSGTVYKLTLLDHVTDADGNTTKTYKPKVKRQIDVLDSSEWSAIHTGMREVVENLEVFDNFKIDVAGKTGTAQQAGHPNHALFIGYAPYDDPEITIATRIAAGYTSHNAADVSKNIIGCYFKDKASLKLLKGGAKNVSGSGSVTD